MRLLPFLLWLIAGLAYMYVLFFGLPLQERPVAPGPLLNPFTGFWKNAEAADLYNDAVWQFDGRDGNIEIVFDGRLVPYIYVVSEGDLAWAQGYLHASFRLWQMDMAVRKTNGELAEILGPALLESDRFQRRKGVRDISEKMVAQWYVDQKSRNVLERYTEGVNAVISRMNAADYPLEFKLLNYQPRLWKPEYTAVMVISMAETLAGKSEDIQRSNIREQFGDSVLQFFFPEYSSKVIPVIPDSALTFRAVLQSKPGGYMGSAGGLVPDLPEIDQPEPGLGSNSWAVSGSRTVSGYPLLANDPHLNLTLPAIWYELQCKTAKFHAHGVSLPGSPGLLIGFNEHYAWGNTNTGHDVLDWYRIQWADDAMLSYVIDGEIEAVSIRTEPIKVRGQRLVTDTVRMTRFGPAVSTGNEDFRDGLAMQWIIHLDDQGDPFRAYQQVIAGSQYGDFREGFGRHLYPSQNYVFASKADTISKLIAGAMPLRVHETVAGIRDGSRSGAGWKGLVPADSLPEMLQPVRGYVSSANQRSTGDAYPYPYYGYFYHFRGNILNRYLDTMTIIDVNAMKRLQLDNYSLLPGQVLPTMLAHIQRSELSHELIPYLDMLASWDHRFEADQQAPAVFLAWWRQLSLMLWDEFDSGKHGLAMINPTDWRTAEFIAGYHEHPFWNIQHTDREESMADILTMSYQQAMDKLYPMLLEPEFDYGRFHGFRISHLAQIPAFSSAPLQINGYVHSLNSLREKGGPSWRMVVDLNPDNYHAHVVYPGGQSGNPGSRYYDNLIQTWASGEYYEVRLIPDAREAIQLLHSLQNR